jgi:hypothetical protein
MSKEEYYNKIKKLIYRKFDELEVFKSTNGKKIYLHYKNSEYANILINKKSGEVYYHYNFRDKFFYTIRLENADFQIFLKGWIENTFQIKVSHPAVIPSHLIRWLKIPTK